MDPSGAQERVNQQQLPESLLLTRSINSQPSKPHGRNAPRQFPAPSFG